MNLTPYLLPLIFLASLSGCGDRPARETTPPPSDPTEGLPAELVGVLDAHGGLADWRAYRQLSYHLPRGEDREFQLVDLHDRREYIRQPAADGAEPVEMGYDGEELWITADTSYQGNPQFYKNLMFYACSPG